jgi:hypothetical protein
MPVYNTVSCSRFLFANIVLASASCCRSCGGEICENGGDHCAASFVDETSSFPLSLSLSLSLSSLPMPSAVRRYYSCKLILAPRSAINFYSMPSRADVLSAVLQFQRPRRRQRRCYLRENATYMRTRLHITPYTNGMVCLMQIATAGSDAVAFLVWGEFNI